MRRLPSEPDSEKYKHTQFQIYQIQKMFQNRMTVMIIVSYLCLFAMLLTFFFNSSLWNNFKDRFNGVDCEVIVPDFVNGNTVLIKCGDEISVIDSGSAEHSEELMQYLNNNKINKLENFFVFEINDGYESVVADIIKSVDINSFIVPPYNEIDGYTEIDEMVLSSEKFHLNSFNGFGFDVEGVLVTVLDEENSSLRISFGENEILVWNGKDGQKELDFIDSNSALNFDMLLINNSQVFSEKLIEFLKPEIIISDKDINIESSDLSAEFYSTSINGDIIIESNEVDIKIKCEKQ